MKENELIALAKATGFDCATVMDAKDLIFEYDFRKYCEMNDCGNYGANYGCPPDCGTPQEMKEKALQYKKALVMQTIWSGWDRNNSQDMASLKRRHNVLCRKVGARLKTEGVCGLSIMAGPCSLCEVCAKKLGQPCQNPENVTSCLSAYGINVMDLCEKTGLQWEHGPTAISFFGLYMF